MDKPVEKSVDNFLGQNVVFRTTKCHNEGMKAIKTAIRKTIRRALGQTPKPMPEHWWKAWEEYQTYEQ